MKKFLVKVGVALLMVLAVHGITVLVFGNGKIDGFYLRFTTPKQHSLVIGNSRAAQGIVPSVVNESLSKTPNKNMHKNKMVYTSLRCQAAGML